MDAPRTFLFLKRLGTHGPAPSDRRGASAEGICLISAICRSLSWDRRELTCVLSPTDSPPPSPGECLLHLHILRFMTCDDFCLLCCFACFSLAAILVRAWLPASEIYATASRVVYWLGHPESRGLALVYLHLGIYRLSAAHARILRIALDSRDIFRIV